MLKRLFFSLFSCTVFLFFAFASLAADFHYVMTLNGDGRTRPKMFVDVTNITSQQLILVVNSPIVDGSGVYHPDIIKMINSVVAKDIHGNSLDVSLSKKTARSSNWYGLYDLHYDVLRINTNGSRQISIEYEIASNMEIMASLGGNVDDSTMNSWHGYLEFILFRPESKSNLSSAKIRYVLPNGWDYRMASIETHFLEEGQIGLGRLDWMYDSNVRWKNYQRSLLVLFASSKFKVNEKNILGVNVVDISSLDLATHYNIIRNTDAFFQYFEYLSKSIGVLPTNTHLTFGAIGGPRLYQEAPYGSSYGLTGMFHGTGGDIGLLGQSLEKVQLWDFNGFDNEKNYTFWMHGVTRPWIPILLQCSFDIYFHFRGGFATYYENIAVAQRYGMDQIIERRFKPMYQYYIDNISGYPEEDQYNFSNHSFKQYFKSALAIYYINELLLEYSNNQKSIDDFMKILFNYAINGSFITKQVFISSLNSLTDYDFTYIVDNYFLGDARLNLDKYLKDSWQSEIGIVNATQAQLRGTLRGFNGSGAPVWSRNINLAGHGRLELDVAQTAGNAASSIKYMRLDIDSGNAVGYQKFYQYRKYRVGLEALPEANQNALYLPHIHSDSEWWTGVGLVNTTSGAKSLDFSFSDGVTASRPLGASSHDSFTVETLRGSVPFVGSAQVPNGAGVAGLMLFSSDRTLSGVSLSDATATSLVFPHVEQNGWWTGIGIYNPNGVPTELSIVGYDRDGNQTDVSSRTVEPHGNLVFPTSFSSTTAWFMVESTQPVTGFELFGTEDGNQLAGYSVVNLATTSGVFPKIERNGWTGIAFVNVGDGAATITLEARNDAGSVVASRVLPLGVRSKIVEVAADLFPGQDIGAATYVRFSSDQNVVGFQLNGSTGGTMLDGIPALGSTHVGSQRLYFPHIHAD